MSGFGTAGRFRSLPRTLRIDWRISVQLASPADDASKGNLDHREGDESQKQHFGGGELLPGV